MAREENKGKPAMQKKRSRRLRDKMSVEEVLLECLHVLSKELDYDVAFQKFLNRLGRYYRADRAYIFEFDWDKQIAFNTYEWCADGVTAEKDNLQNVPISVVDRWMRLFEESGEFYITSLEQDVDKDSDEYMILAAQGIQGLMAAPIYNGDTIIGILGVDDPSEGVKDLTLLKASAEFVGEELQKAYMVKKLQYESHVDLLTGLNNRNKYMDVLNGYEEKALTSIGIVFADMNGIKRINDTYGHKYGDRLIVKAADSFKKTAGTSAYRIGGDEFVVLFENISQDDFRVKVIEIKQALDDNDCDVSMGCVWQTGDFDVNSLIQQADKQMYAEKQNYYQKALKGEHHRRIKIVSTVEKEIAENHFTVFYQPQVQMETGQIIGAEALVRKVAADGTIIVPDKFIPYYEVMGVVRHIDLFVLENVCKLLQRWDQKGKSAEIAVNFSRITLMETNIVETIIGICEAYQVPPSSIIIEVTESVNKLAPEHLKTMVHKFKESGFILALDDFGSKYSNIAILNNITFNAVKIDKSLIDKIETNERSRMIVQSIIQMVHQIEHTYVVAEGVETEKQHKILNDFGCEAGQGYLYSKPIPLADFERITWRPQLS